MNNNLFPKLGATGFMLGAALMVTLTGCVGYSDHPHSRNVYVEPAPVVFVEVDDYVYYPRYQMYYGSRTHQYYYQDGRSWVARPAPRGVSVNVLYSSPSVAVDFHDRPSAHHAEVIRSYPKHWTPPGADRGRKEGQRDDHDNGKGNGKGNSKH